ncbi:MAG: hypothetical protein ABGX83_07255 [Nitrospira sp.]|nr:hypothetical protein [Candidatus Manganitrophaceae bacterium]HIL35498.1 hypothetical protein [Candidatus Manganitrophaceae bacterium]
MKKLVIMLISLPMALGLLYAQPVEAKTKKPLTICRWIKTSWICSEATKGLKKAKAIPTLEKIFTEDYDRIWDAMIAVMEDKGLAVHPHGKMKVKKKKGRIKTKVFRYFKIFSAKPPVVELDFRDSYKLRIQRIEVELPKAKAKVASASKADAKTSDKPGKPADSKVVKGEEEASAAPTVTRVKLTIKRKFQVHDDMTRKWLAGDPEKYKVGYTTKYLLEAIEAKLKGSAKSKNLTNLIITPPVFVK